MPSFTCARGPPDAGLNSGAALMRRKRRVALPRRRLMYAGGQGGHRCGFDRRAV
jgi:hypothetical protein